MNIKKLLIKTFTFIGGLYFFLEFVMPESVFDFDKYHESISNAFITMSCMAVGLGIINLMVLHLDRIVYKKKDYFFSLTLLLSLFITLVILSLDWYQNEKIVSKANKFLTLSKFSEVILDDEKAKNSKVLAVNIRNQKLISELEKDINLIDKNSININEAKERELKEVLERVEKSKDNIKKDYHSTKYNLNLSKRLRNLSIVYREYLQYKNKDSLIKKLYLICFDGFFNPLVMSMFSLLGFYVATAAFKAFKIKSFESFLMMLSALIVILGQVPFGVKIWNGFPSLRLWLLSVPSTGAFRAITLGAFIAGLVMALRMWFSLEGHEKGGKN